MPDAIDPWEAASGGRRPKERKKSVRIAGNAKDKAHVLIKCHDWRGRAIYVYHLLSGELKRIDKPSQDEWDTFTKLGEELTYPTPDHPSSDVKYWVQFGKDQAQKNGIKVTE